MIGWGGEKSRSKNGRVVSGERIRTITTVREAENGKAAGPGTKKELNHKRIASVLRLLCVTGAFSDLSVFPRNLELKY